MMRGNKRKKLKKIYIGIKNKENAVGNVNHHEKNFETWKLIIVFRAFTFNPQATTTFNPKVIEICRIFFFLYFIYDVNLD